jgi:Domain of unknown function (DUF4440)
VRLGGAGHGAESEDRGAAGAACAWLLLGGAGLASAGAPLTLGWFQATEQALMDAVASGDKAVWDLVMDAECVVTTEEGQVLLRRQFLDELRPLPAGLSGHIAVEELTLQELPGLVLVRYLADETESVFGQSLVVGYRVTVPTHLERDRPHAGLEAQRHRTIHEEEIRPTS